MGQIRPFFEEDIPQVADLHQRAFRGKASQQTLRSFLSEILLHNPWYDEAMPSLVYEDSKGKIVGFLGVMPRPMSMNGRTVQAAVATTFMVEPGSRSSLAGVKLLKTFLSGPQDLSMCDYSNDSARKVWEGLGGTTARLYSIRWKRPLRPSRYVMSLLKKPRLLASLAYASSPFCRIVDAIATRMPQKPFRQLAPRVSGEDLKVETLLACLPTFAGGRSLRPEYDDRSLTWVLDIMAQRKGPGTFRKVVVRSFEQEILGWYLYYLNPGGISEVVQIAAIDTSINEVLDHLFYDAWRQGAIALSGRLEPRFMREFSDKYCLFHCGDHWTLVHSRNAELLRTIYRGDAFLTRLEGEWWTLFED